MKKIEKLVIVAPGPEFSTFDVWTGICAGFQKIGIKVRAFHFHSRLKYHRQATTAMYETGVSPFKVDNITAALMAGNDVLADVMRMDPDAVLVVTGGLLDPEVPQILTDRGYPTFLLMTESPYETEIDTYLARRYVGCFSSDVLSVPEIKRTSGNPNIWYLPHAYNADIHKPPALVEGKYISDAVMVGTGFTERVDLLKQVPWEKLGCELRLYGTWHKTEGTPLRKYWQTPEASNDLMTGAINNDYVNQLYRGAKVSINIHRTTKFWNDDPALEEHVTDAYSVNPRVFEVMASGGVLVTDYRQELYDLFQSRGYLAYRSPEELAAQVKTLLVDDNLRVKLREEAIEAVKPYNFAGKAARMLGLMNDCLNNDGKGGIAP